MSTSFLKTIFITADTVQGKLYVWGAPHSDSGASSAEDKTKTKPKPVCKEMLLL